MVESIKALVELYVACNSRESVPEVKECCKGLTECDQGGAYSYDCSCEHIVPVMNCIPVSDGWADEEQTHVHSSMVSAPEIRVAPSKGANMRIIFQYAGLCALITLSWALKYKARYPSPAHAAVE